MTRSKAIQMIDRAIDIAMRMAKNCGAGAPGSQGFQPGNTCAGGGGGGSSGGGGGDSGDDDAPKDGGGGDGAVDDSDFSSEKLFTEEERQGWGARQPVNSKDELYNMAKTVRPEFVKILNTGVGVDKTLGANAAHVDTKEAFAKAIESDGHTVIIGGIKTEKAATDKVNGKHGGDWTRLKDVVRATVAVESKEDLLPAVDAVRAHMESKGYELVEVDNRMENPTPSGYRDINTAWRSPEGMVTELQINTKAMIRAKELDGGHAMYEEHRAIVYGINNRGTPATSEETAKLSELESKMGALYTEAWSK